MYKTSNQPAELQPLERRTLFATVTPLAVSTLSSAIGNILNIVGTTGNDRIDVRNTSSGIRISNSTGWSRLYTGSVAQIRVDGRAGDDRIEINGNIRTEAVLYGGPGVDTLVGGSGNDRLYGGDGRDYLYGQGGNDVLVTIGDGSVDRLYGGAGYDSFWADSGSNELIVDASTDEVTGGAIHRISSFFSPHFSNTGVTFNTPETLLGQNLPDPALAGYASHYQNLSRYPLFSPKYGPRPDDIYQGALGDCYLLASLGSVASANPQVIRDMIVDLGDGTYAVQFTQGNSKVFVRVDADLPMTSAGMAYAKLGRQGSLWAALVEKAYAYFRYNLASYGSIEGGFMGDVYSHMGLSNSSRFTVSSAMSLLQGLQADLAAGRAVTFGTRSDVGDAPCIGGHAYEVHRVITDSAGRVTHVQLRNPWGIDGVPGHGANDGYVTLTAAQALRAFWFTCSAQIRGGVGR